MSGVCVAGAAILDVMLRPVSRGVFEKGSHPVDGIRLTTGGDALNEATVLARLGAEPVLITKLGEDDAANLIEAHCAREGICLEAVRDAALDTSVNAVLVDEVGERVFLTDPNSTLRRLTARDILEKMDSTAVRNSGIFCLASLFVSHAMDIDAMAGVLSEYRRLGKTVCADTTKPKHGETVRDAGKLFSQLDVFFANREEGAMLTGRETPEEITMALEDSGVKTAAVKLGAEGCILRTGGRTVRVPAMQGVHCVDTTGAGDTFAGAFLCALDRGERVEMCAAYASAAAGLCTEHLGATAYKPDPERISVEAKRILERI